MQVQGSSQRPEKGMASTALVIIEKEKEYKVKKILNKKKFREKNKYLVQWREYIVKENT